MLHRSLRLLRILPSIQIHNSTPLKVNGLRSTKMNPRPPARVGVAAAASSSSSCQVATTLLRATVRNVPSEATVSLSFVYSDLIIKKPRQFNFQRQRNEPLDTVKARIVANIQKQIDKKKKKKQKKKEEEEKTTEELQPQIDNELDLKVELLLKLEEEEGGTVNWKEIAGDTVCADAFTSGNRLLIGTSVFDVVVNPPTVSSLSLPSNIMASFPVHPKVELEFASLQRSSFTWYRSSSSSDKTNPDEWESVGKEYFYMTRTEDIGRLLRVVCSPKRETADGREEVGEPLEAVSKVAVGAGPGLCPFDTRHHFTKMLTDRGSFRFVSYNILADLYADSEFSREVLYPYCPPYALALDYRKQLLCKELSGYNADVICLQEVDEKVYEKELKPTFGALGIGGTFHLKGGQVAEGLASFYRKSKFRYKIKRNFIYKLERQLNHLRALAHSLKTSHKMILSEEIERNPLFASFLTAVNQNEKLKETFMQRTTALQVTVLESSEDPTKTLCIGNTHLYFRPDRDNIRLLQTGMCVAYLEQIVTKEASERPDSKVAAILCGDFNSTPEFGVYQLMTERSIPTDHRDWRSNEEEVVHGLSLSHSFEMESACGTPRYTNFTVGFADCLDYIFIDKTKLNVQQVVPFPSEEELRQHVALPSVTMPSDHIALVADIRWHDFTIKTS